MPTIYPESELKKSQDDHPRGTQAEVSPASSSSLSGISGSRVVAFTSQTTVKVKPKAIRNYVPPGTLVTPAKPNVVATDPQELLFSRSADFTSLIEALHKKELAVLQRKNIGMDAEYEIHTLLIQIHANERATKILLPNILSAETKNKFNKEDYENLMLDKFTDTDIMHNFLIIRSDLHSLYVIKQQFLSKQPIIDIIDFSINSEDYNFLSEELERAIQIAIATIEYYISNKNSSDAALDNISAHVSKKFSIHSAQSSFILAIESPLEFWLKSVDKIKRKYRKESCCTIL